MDFLTKILESSAANKRAELQRLVNDFAHQLVAESNPEAKNLVRAVEMAVSESPEKFIHFDSDNNAVVRFNQDQWNAGVFETTSIENLRNRVPKSRSSESLKSPRLSMILGAGPITDIGTLQAYCGNETLFQVASQFNCLEAPRPCIVPVYQYFNDPTQGPRASISAFPGTLVRHYCAPATGRKFTQNESGDQINLLDRACEPTAVSNGYFTGDSLVPPKELEQQIHENFEQISVGIQSNTEVVFGHNWNGSIPANSHLIAQVFTSTVAGGSYGGNRNLGSSFRPINLTLLRAAYLGTLLTAIYLDKKRVVLTLIGGGVFQNDFNDIWNAILWAVDEIEPYLTAPMDIVINGYRLPDNADLSNQIHPEIMKRNGIIATIEGFELVSYR